jgi:hypothetical protein
MSEAFSVVAGVRIDVSGRTATAAKLNFGAGGNIIAPSSVFFPCLAEKLAVTQIGDRAFDKASIISITIPRHVQILCSLCFSHCESLSSISFETDSELTRIEAGAFAGTNFDCVIVPRSTSFIAGNAFPCYCDVTLAGADSDAVLRQGNLRHRSGWSDMFERKPWRR